MNLIEDTIEVVGHPGIRLTSVTNPMPALAQRCQNARGQIVDLKFSHGCNVIS